MFYTHGNVYGKHCRLVKTVSLLQRWSLQVETGRGLPRYRKGQWN